MMMSYQEPGEDRPPDGDVTTKPKRGTDSQSWYLAQANLGQQLLGQGQLDQAREVFAETLAGLGEEPSYSRAVIMERLGRCCLMGGTPLPAAEFFQRAMEITESIAASDGVKGLQGVLQSSLGDAFRTAGRFDEARKSYEAALAIAANLKDKRAQGVDLDHLGSLALQEGRLEEAFGRFEGALRIFEEIGERAPQGIAHHHLGMAFEQAGRLDDAERHYIKAAGIMETCGDVAGVAGCQSHVAGVMEKSGRGEEAEDRYRKALEAARQSANPVEMRRQLLNLARFLLGRSNDLAEIRHLVEEALARSGSSLDAEVWATYGLLADIVEREAAAVEDDAARAALGAQADSFRHIQQFGPRLLTTLTELGPQPGFGRAVILERLARCCLIGGRPGPAVLLFRQAIETAEQLEAKDSVAGLKGVLQSGLGDAFQMAGHVSEAQTAFKTSLEIAEDLGDLRTQGMLREHLGGLAFADDRITEALMHCQSALGIFQTLRARAPEAVAFHNLAVALEQTGEVGAAAEHFLQAARLREEIGDADGAAQSRALGAALRERHGLPADDTASASDAEDTSQGEDGNAAAQANLDISVHEELSTDCVFGSDLLIDVRRESKVRSYVGTPELLPGDIVPTFVPGVRTCNDEDGTPRFYLPPGEPVYEQHTDCVVMRRLCRELAVVGNPDIVWRLVRSLDGARTVDAILVRFPSAEREAARGLLAALAANGALDLSGRPIGRFIHAATKKGVVAGGGLEGDDVLRLATDGNYRTYAGAEQIALGDAVPDRLRSYHSLTRARRSRRDYAGKPITREEFDALLHTACGVTGAMPWGDRELKLRAYPSSGALYAVEIYPVTFRVEGLEPAVYHYVAGKHALDVVNADAAPDRFVAASLPVEREMVSGIAAAFCLVGRFKRHERKYGQGGYRMMVAEAGHISQNLVLTAVALGLTARPFGGVFDSLINEHLGLDEAEEQFLLSVLVGHAGAGIDAQTIKEKPGETT